MEYRIPFDRIRAEHVQPAAQELLRKARSGLDALAADPNPRSFDNTLGSLDGATESLDIAMGVVKHLESVATYPELRAAYNAVEPEVSAFYSSIPLNERLWKALQEYAASPNAAALEGTRKRFLTKTLDSFRRHGAELDPPGKTRLQELDIELAKLTTRFAENVLDSTNAFDLILQDERKLAGLPESAREAARQSAAAKGLDGWRFTLQAPSYTPLMMYLDDAAIRKEVYRAFSLRATSENHDNRPLIGRILELRREKAKILGFQNFADLVLYDRMAHTGERAQGFLDELREKTKPHFERENRDLLEFRRRLEGPGAPELEPWDVSYYAEKQRAALFDFDEEELRPYFPLQRVTERPVSDRESALWDPDHRGIRHPGMGPARPVLHGTGPGRHVPGRVLHGLVPAREQARRRLDGRIDYGHSGG